MYKQMCRIASSYNNPKESDKIISEILLNIFNYLDIEELYSLQKICKLFNTTINGDPLLKNTLEYLKQQKKFTSLNDIFGLTTISFFSPFKSSKENMMILVKKLSTKTIERIQKYIVNSNIKNNHLIIKQLSDIEKRINLIENDKKIKEFISKYYPDVHRKIKKEMKTSPAKIRLSFKLSIYVQIFSFFCLLATFFTDSSKEFKIATSKFICIILFITIIDQLFTYCYCLPNQLESKYIKCAKTNFSKTIEKAQKIERIKVTTALLKLLYDMINKTK